jgi:nicotinamidase-related amidase
MLIICGQASSHCVNYTTRDIVEGLTREQAAQIYLVCDGSSPVTGFEADAKKFYTEMAACGVNVVTFAELEKRLA